MVYDCMDELAAFKGAPPELLTLEELLLGEADLVFTGGHSLHEAKRGLHPSVHLFRRASTSPISRRREARRLAARGWRDRRRSLGCALDKCGGRMLGRSSHLTVLLQPAPLRRRCRQGRTGA